MSRDNVIYFMNCYMLDVNHNHTVNFKDKASQVNWFLDKVLFTVNDTMYTKRNQSIIVDRYIHDRLLTYSNYLMLVNEEGKEEFYFITNKIYESDYSTRITIKLDVIQTFWFDISFSKFSSLIDRCHLDRWKSDGTINVYNMMEDEGLEVGEYLKSEVNTVYDYSNKGSFIVTSSSPLSSKTGGSSSSSSSSSGSLWRSGLVSENGFVLIKCMEGFSSVPYDLGDGTLTIGYGTTSVYDSEHYAQLAPQCTEEQASEVFGDSLDEYSSYVLSQLKASGKDLTTVKQCHFDAFVSFYYNTGSLTSRQIWVNYINGVDDESIAELWKTTVIMAGSAFEDGLRDRREREANAFLGTYNFKSISDLTTGSTITDNDGKGYVPSRYIVTETDISALRQSIVNSAKKLLGLPYVYGGNYPPLGSSSGTDCSGLCQWAYNDNGISISRTTYTQIKEGKLVSQSEAKAGDLVFTRGYGDNGHVVMFLSDNGDGTIHVIEAKQTGTNIMENDRTPDSLYMFRNLIGD